MGRFLTRYEKVRSCAYNLISTEAEEPSRWNKTINISIILLIIGNVLAILLESVQPIYTEFESFFIGFDTFSVAVFTVEYAIRVWVSVESPSRGSPLRGRLSYMVTPLALIDLLAILPFYLPLFFVLDLRFLRVMRLLRTFRLFKLARYTSALNLIKASFTRNKEVLVSSFIILVILLIVSSTLMFHVENEAQPEVFDSIPATMWWAIATLTTVGYGDIYPVTALGKFLGSFIAILGIATVAIPTGVLASTFIEEMERRKEEERGEDCNDPENTITLLERLARLKDGGFITDDEFREQKEKLLKSGRSE